MIIGIVGQANSGKDTLANFLVDRYGLTQVTFATPMKQFIWKVFDFSKEQLWGPSQYRNQVDHRYNRYDLDEGQLDSAWAAAFDTLQREGMPWLSHLHVHATEQHFKALVDWFHWLGTHYPNSLTPRIALQTLGNEWGRNKVDENLWVNYALETAQEKATGVVISDIRYKNELEAIKAAGGKVLQITRPAATAKVGINLHTSETEQQDFDISNIDFFLSNDGSLNDLYEDVEICAGCLGLVPV